ncbi:MAG TPA: hypothetical protein VK169_11820 [Saprospiraceae bacterium]|nr:hypothetical protein [Saprospiraceae bacterium]
MFYVQEQDDTANCTYYYTISAPTVGFQFFFIKPVTLDFGIEGSYLLFTKDSDLELKKLDLIAQLRIGYAF